MGSVYKSKMSKREASGDLTIFNKVCCLGVTSPQPAWTLEIAVVATRLVPMGDRSSLSIRQVGLVRVEHPDPAEKCQGRIRTETGPARTPVTSGLWRSGTREKKVPGTRANEVYKS